ncbi:sensor domain-containing diguanylate cyclase [Azonexus caeni]|jgi:diguanylate cyclase (GGDEF)-like protein|uniref:sensor domain-containing diguanylate cyclase n=1 Tax=Azonexus caeni TaxID=266126 RepID=UPI003A8A2343
MPTKNQLLEINALQTAIIKLGPDLGAVLSLVVDTIVPLIAADGAVIELAEGDEMVYRAASGIGAAHLGLRLQREGSLSGACIAIGKTLRSDDTDADPRVDREACRRVGLRSMLVLPLIYREQAIGVLKAMSITPKGFSAADETLLNLLSESVSAAMYHATQLGSDDLFHRATHDPLTGLANRALFMDRLRNVIARRPRTTAPAGVLMIDMDGLKRINDTYGHRTGDLVIREFAQRIHATARHSDTVARLGGDEFAIILQPVEPIPHGIEAAVDRLEQQISQPFSVDGLALPLRASIGAAAFPHDSDDIAALLELADQRMYACKNARYAQAH